MRQLLILAAVLFIAASGCTGRPPLQPGGTGPVEAGKVRLTYFGDLMFLVEERQNSLIVDPYGPDIGYIVPKVRAQMVLISHEGLDHSNAAAITGRPRIVDTIGKSYVGRFSVLGVPSFRGPAHASKQRENTIYYWEMGGMSFAHMGDFGQPSLTSQQQGVLRNVDVLMIPVGGKTAVDSRTAAKLAKVIGPKVVIPMGYKTPVSLVNLAPVETFTSRFTEIRHIGDSVQISRKDLPSATEVWVMKYRQ